MYEIENDVPTPSDGLGRKQKYVEMYEALSKLNIGQSFIMPVDNVPHATSLGGSIHTHGKRNNKKFVTRSIKAQDSVLMRIWRIE